MTVAQAIKKKKRLTAELMRLVQKREKYFLVNENAMENPYDYEVLSKEIKDKMVAVDMIQFKINRTNLGTKVNYGDMEITLYDAIIGFGSLKAELSNIEKLIAKIPSDDDGNEMYSRRKKDEITFKPIVDLDYLTKGQEKLEKKKDELDELIQKTNWSTEII